MELDISTEIRPFRIMASGWKSFPTDSCLIGRLISAKETWGVQDSFFEAGIIESSPEASNASFLRIRCQ